MGSAGDSEDEVELLSRALNAAVVGLVFIAAVEAGVPVDVAVVDVVRTSLESTLDHRL